MRGDPLRRGKAMKRHSNSAAALAGLAGGLLGAWAMDQFTRAWNHFVSEAKQLSPPYSAQEWDSTSRTASWVANFAFGRELTRREKIVGAQLMHYGVGSAAGAIYGLWRARRSHSTLASGVAFGFALWLVGEEIAMPLLGINDPAQAYSIADHANSLGEHIAYGVTTAVITRALAG
jgi:uncharacterized membrane protein YagU involved in acid resistance